MKVLETAERVTIDIANNYVYQRSLLAYLEAAKMISGDLLEVGAGSGYGTKHLAPKTKSFLIIDKFPVKIDPAFTNVTFRQMNIPPFEGIEDEQFDFVISFQVIEHIEDDRKFVSEIHRVLRPGGVFIVTTPNIKMSITRNPWHVREYTIDELDTLLKSFFSSVKTNGVFGNDKITDYFEKNKASVKKITRFDIFNLQYRLPRRLLQIPYDILNNINRKKLLNENNSLVSDIHYTDYNIGPANDNCFDLFYVATK